MIYQATEDFKSLKESNDKRADKFYKALAITFSKEGMQLLQVRSGGYVRPRNALVGNDIEWVINTKGILASSGGLVEDYIEEREQNYESLMGVLDLMEGGHEDAMTRGQFLDETKGVITDVKCQASELSTKFFLQGNDGSVSILSFESEKISQKYIFRREQGKVLCFDKDLKNLIYVNKIYYDPTVINLDSMREILFPGLESFVKALFHPRYKDTLLALVGNAHSENEVTIWQNAVRNPECIRRIPLSLDNPCFRRTAGYWSLGGRSSLAVNGSVCCRMTWVVGMVLIISSRVITSDGSASSGFV